jgi:hypothetical protein
VSAGPAELKIGILASHKNPSTPWTMASTRLLDCLTALKRLVRALVRASASSCSNATVLETPTSSSSTAAAKMRTSMLLVLPAPRFVLYRQARLYTTTVQSLLLAFHRTVSGRQIDEPVFGIQLTGAFVVVVVLEYWTASPWISAPNVTGCSAPEKPYSPTARQLAASVG